MKNIRIHAEVFDITGVSIDNNRMYLNKAFEPGTSRIRLTIGENRWMIIEDGKDTVIKKIN